MNLLLVSDILCYYKIIIAVPEVSPAVLFSIGFSGRILR